MAAGAWRAILTEGRTNIAATGEIRKDFLETWKAKNLNSGASVNPPGCMASALNVTVHLLLGKEFKSPVSAGKYGNALYIPIPFIDKSNFDQAYKQVEGKPGHYSVSDSLTIEEAAAYFK
jgi:ribose transport system substrate-binding protein